MPVIDERENEITTKSDSKRKHDEPGPKRPKLRKETVKDLDAKPGAEKVRGGRAVPDSERQGCSL